MDTAGRRDDVHQLRGAVPAAHRGRRDRRRDAEHGAAEQARGQDRRSGARHLRPAQHRRAGAERRHRRSHRRCCPAGHRHRLGHGHARVPARGVGAPRRRGEPRPAQGQGRGRPPRLRRRRTRDDRGLHGRLRPGRLDHPAAGHRRGRLGRDPAADRRVPGGRARQLPAPAVRADPAARRRTAAPPADGGRTDRRDRVRAAEAAAQRLYAGRGDEEHVRRVRCACRPAAVDQLHLEAGGVLRRLDGDAEQGGRARRRVRRPRRAREQEPGKDEPGKGQPGQPGVRNGPDAAPGRAAATGG